MMKPTRWLLAFWLLTITFTLLFVADAFPWLRGDASWIPPHGRWRWPYAAPAFSAVIFPTIGVGAYLLGAWRLLHSRRTRPLLLWAYGGAVLLPLLLMTIEGDPLYLLFARTAAPVVGGYQYAAAYATDFGAALRHWPTFVQAYSAEAGISPPSGVVLSPPGLVALFEGTSALFAAVPPAAERFSDMLRPLQCQNLTVMSWHDADLASAWGQMLMPFWAALGVAPLYQLGVRLFGRWQARLAVLLWPLVPGMAIFQPRFNVFFPLLTLVLLVTLWLGLRDNRRGWIARSGFVLSVGILLNLSLVPLGLLAGLIILAVRLLPLANPQGSPVIPPPPRRLLIAMIDLVVFGLGVVSVWVIYGLLAGIAPFDVLRTGFSRHAELYRPYLPWLIMHPYDTFLFVGLPITLLAGWRVVSLARLRTRGSAPTQGDVLAGATALTLIILVLSGTARGETGRVWLFFAPVWLLLAADKLAELRAPNSGCPRVALQVLVMESIVLLGMAAGLRANFTGFTVPVRVASAQTIPMFPVEAHFERDGDAVTLVGLSTATGEDTVTLDLYWRAETHVERPYVLSLVSVPPDGSPWESLNWNPRGWDYPPSCWRPGQVFADSVAVPLGENAPIGGWLFSLSIRDVFTHEPMRVRMADGTITTQVGIGPVPFGEAAAQPK